MNEYSCKEKYSRCLCLAPLGLNTQPRRSSQFTSGAVYSLGLTFSGPKGKQKLPRFWALGREAVVPSSSFRNSQNSCHFLLVSRVHSGYKARLEHSGLEVMLCGWIAKYTVMSSLAQEIIS